MAYKYLFGPVPSRRLGISLGIDMVPFKTCNLNCVYCECGAAEKHSTERKEYIASDEIINELKSILKPPLPEYATFSGGGEPTLNSSIGKVIRFLKKEYPSLKVALLTNGLLLYDKKVRDDIALCDIVLPSVDAVFPDVFQKLNRPAAGLSLEKYLEGLKAFSREFQGELWVEVFLAKGFNDGKDHLQALGKYLRELSPDRVQLNTLDRPAASSGVLPLSKQELRDAMKILDVKGIEIISKFTSRREIASYREDKEQLIADTLRRRPCTLEDLAEVTGLKIQELNKYLDVLEKEKMVKSKMQDRGIFLIYNDRNKK